MAQKATCYFFLFIKSLPGLGKYSLRVYSIKGARGFSLALVVTHKFSKETVLELGNVYFFEK